MTTTTVWWDHTPEITGRILDYRDGKIPFAQLLDELAKRDYVDPPHYAEHGDILDISEAASRDTPGSVHELTIARDRRLLTSPEYEAILSAILRAHGA